MLLYVHNLLKPLSSFQIGKLQVWQNISPYRCSNDHFPKVWSWHGCRLWVRKGIRTKVWKQNHSDQKHCNYLFQVFYAWSHKSEVFTPEIEEDLGPTSWHYLVVVKQIDMNFNSKLLWSRSSILRDCFFVKIWNYPPCWLFLNFKEVLISHFLFHRQDIESDSELKKL